MRAGYPRFSLLCAVAVLIGLVWPGPAAYAEYPDHDIDLIIPYGPGGGFDLYARAVAKEMDAQLPKGITVVPRNIPGAGSVKGISWMYRAAPDGYTMGIVDLPGAVEPVILGEPTAYDLDKVTWLGLVNIGVYSLVVGKNSRFQNLDAFRNPQGRAPFIATTGSNDLAMAKIVAAALHLDVKYLTGYSGGPDTQLAIIRGEADAGLSMDVTIAKYLKSGDLRQLVWLDARGARDAPKDVPTADDVGHPELANLGLYRMFAAPPGLPAAVQAKLISIVQGAMHSPDLAAWSQQAQFPLDIGSPEKARALYVQQKEFLEKYKDLLAPQ
jgi:tripartite-type tricarboxylate transporter receptor subunit TctC